MSAPLILRTSVGKHAHVQPLWDGTASSPRIRLDMIPVDPLPNAFRRMVQTLEFDLCEMALATHALAIAHGKPIRALPIPLWRHYHHKSLICLVGSPLRGPKDLQGRKVGVRSYSQTTGVWVRGILKSEYGIDLDDVTWVTTEGAHVAEYQDPPNVVRAESGKTLRDLMVSGEVDAVMGLRTANPADVRTVIPDADAAAAAWHRKTGIFPVNHVVAVKAELLDAHPWLAGEIFNLFVRAKSQSRSGDPTAEDAFPYGVEPNRLAMQTLLDYTADQRLTPRAYSADELFDVSLAEAA